MKTEEPNVFGFKVPPIQVPEVMALHGKDIVRQVKNADGDVEIYVHDNARKSGFLSKFDVTGIIKDIAAGDWLGAVTEVLEEVAEAVGIREDDDAESVVDTVVDLVEDAIEPVVEAIKDKLDGPPFNVALSLLSGWLKGQNDDQEILGWLDDDPRPAAKKMYGLRAAEIQEG